MTNWMPRTLGPMILRPGMGYLDTTFTNLFAKHIPFIFSNSDTAIIELTNAQMRVRVSEAIVTRASVSTAITNPNFGSNLTGWTSADESGATSSWATGGYMSLVGTKFNAAIRYQTVTVAGGDQNVEHALTIVVNRGNPSVRIGSTVGGEEYIADTILRPGYHSIAFTPTGNFTIYFSGKAQWASLIDSCNIESAGAMAITTPWQAADLGSTGNCLIRTTQSADVIFVAALGYQQYRIERHASNSRSWSVVKYLPEDGPFRIVNTSPTTLTASATTGDITVTSSRSIFKSTHVGSVWRIASIGQRVDASAAGAGQWTNAIKVTGVGTSRQFTITIAGTWVGTVTLQRSVGAVGSWSNVANSSWTANTVSTYNDTLDNQIIFYRIGFDTGNYTSGTASLTLEYSTGSITGVFLITAYTSGTSVSAAVVTDLGSTTATNDWSEGVWSDYRGWPGAVVLYEGRLWWLGKNWVIGSVSDAYDSFDDQIEGDSAPIIRTIGSGPVDIINWALGMQRLILGAEGSEISVRSTTFDEPLTPTNFNLKEASTQGSGTVPALKLDTFGIFIQRGGTRVFELEYDPQKFDYASNEVTILCPEIGEPGIYGMAVQRQPDPRIHLWKSDGTGFIVLFNPAENLRCLVDVTTDGVIEDVFVLPRAIEDAVYYVVKRTINGATKRYLEKWSKISECQGGTTNKQADAFVTYSQAASTTITGLSHLEAKSVVVWDNGACLANADGTIATFTVTSGQITGLTHYGVAYNATVGMVGLQYTAQFKSTKLAYAASLGTALGQRKQISTISFIGAAIHHLGVTFGPDFSHLTNLSQTISGAVVARDTVHTTLDDGTMTFPSDNSQADARMCLQAVAPRPATILAVVIGIDTTEDAP